MAWCQFARGLGRGRSASVKAVWFPFGVSGAAGYGPFMRTWLLVHSPLLGPLTWRGVAEALRARGDDVVVPDLRPTLSLGRPYARSQARLATRDLKGGSIVVVAHSGAGALVPLVIDALPACSSGGSSPKAVFVDAGLPHPGSARFDTLPPATAEHPREMARDGLLPPWPRWWPEDVLRQLVPNHSLRAGLIAESPPLPLALFEEAVPGADLPPDIPAAYLRLSDGYDEAARQAEVRGWNVRLHRSDHLAPLTRPEQVARWLLDAVLVDRS